MSSLAQLFTHRLLLVTGKGGVGKTTVAAALGRAGAKDGRRVLVAEISYESPVVGDGPTSSAPTSPLANALGSSPLGDEPRRVETHEGGGSLDAIRLSPFAGHVEFLRDALPMRLLADAAMRSAAVRRFFSAAPTLPELGIIYRLLSLLDRVHHGKPAWDLVVCDLPATGHALALAQVPKTLAEVIRGGPIHAAAERGLRVLRDPKMTTSVLVTLPEPLPVSEALELHEGLHRLGIGCGLVLLNRVPPNPFTVEERAAAERLVADKMRTLGARSLPRMDRADAAYQRLAKSLGLPVQSISEVAANIDEYVASQLGRAP